MLFRFALTIVAFATSAFAFPQVESTCACTDVATSTVTSTATSTITATITQYVTAPGGSTATATLPPIVVVTPIISSPVVPYPTGPAVPVYPSGTVGTVPGPVGTGILSKVPAPFSNGASSFNGNFVVAGFAAVGAMALLL